MKNMIIIILLLFVAACDNARDQKALSQVAVQTEGRADLEKHENFHYKIPYNSIERIAQAHDENPFREFSKEPVGRLLRQAGLVYTEGVLLRYRWEDETLMVWGPEEFHLQVERILGVGRSAPTKIGEK